MPLSSPPSAFLTWILTLKVYICSSQWDLMCWVNMDDSELTSQNRFFLSLRPFVGPICIRNASFEANRDNICQLCSLELVIQIPENTSNVTFSPSLLSSFPLPLSDLKQHLLYNFLFLWLMVTALPALRSPFQLLL